MIGVMIVRTPAAGLARGRCTRSGVSAQGQLVRKFECVKGCSGALLPWTHGAAASALRHFHSSSHTTATRQIPSHPPMAGELPLLPGTRSSVPERPEIRTDLMQRDSI